jgi:hypothetical protein
LKAPPVFPGAFLFHLAPKKVIIQKSGFSKKILSLVKICTLLTLIVINLYFCPKACIFLILKLIFMRYYLIALLVMIFATQKIFGQVIFSATIEGRNSAIDLTNGAIRDLEENNASSAMEKLQISIQKKLLKILIIH